MARDFLKPLVGTPTDYQNKENWMYLDENPKYEVDTIYFYPTMAMEPGADGYCGDINDAMKAAAKFAYIQTGQVFEGYTNMFAPYYRQVSGKVELDFTDIKSAMDGFYSSAARTDVYAALDEYFAKYNNGRPFIFSGHSQGSAMIRMILEDYMQVHPDYLERMIAAYAIGFGFDGKYFSRNTQVLPAAEEFDTGVVVSWNTEGPGATKPNLVINAPCCCVINPLTWTTDDSYGSADKNLGSLEVNSETGECHVIKGYGDAQVDARRGALICTTETHYTLLDLFGDRSLHTKDYSLYWENIKENGRNRIDAFLGSRDGRQNKMSQIMNDPEKRKKAKPIAIIASIIMILIGISLFLDTVATSTFILWIIVIGVLVGGIEKIITYFQRPKGHRDGSVLAIGIVWIIAAILLLIGAIDHAFMATASLTWAVGILAGIGLLVAGINQLTIAGDAKKNGGSQALCIICGILELICSLFVITAPIIGFVAINFVFGVFLAVYGVILLIRAISIK